MLSPSMYAFLTALVRDELRRYEIKKSTQLRGFCGYLRFYEIQRNLIRQHILLDVEQKLMSQYLVFIVNIF